jgi:transcriptional regulator with XRE-family HTH domain
MNTIFIDQNVGEILARHRDRQGMTLHQVGQAAKVPHSYVSAVEHGRKKISPKMAERLANAVCMKPDDKNLFMLCAAHHGKLAAQTRAAREIPQSLTNAVADWLTTAVDASKVEACYSSIQLHQIPAPLAQRLKEEAGKEFHPNFALKMKDGTWNFLEIKSVKI